jgi:hypothetical protein
MRRLVVLIDGTRNSREDNVRAVDVPITRIPFPFKLVAIALLFTVCTVRLLDYCPERSVADR